MSNLRGRTTSSTSLNRLSTSKTPIDTNQNKSIKKKALTKPAWDVIKIKFDKNLKFLNQFFFTKKATNTDLDQHKATAEEIVNNFIILRLN